MIGDAHKEPLGIYDLIPSGKYKDGNEWEEV